MKKKKKVKLKKAGYIAIFGLIILILLIIFGIKKYQNYQYKQTDEYKLMNKGYTLEDTKILLNKLNHDEIISFLDQDYDENRVAFVTEKYFIFRNLDAYLSYQMKNKETEINDIIAIVNVHADHKWYQLDLKTDSTLNERMIVNKFYTLTNDYTPTNLKNISLDYSYGSDGENQLIDYAYDHFVDLWTAAHDAGYDLMVTSSYRNYKDQEDIYNYRKNTQGEKKADETAARPGHSEHQTGLVVDMTSKTEPSDTEFQNSEAYKWLQNNAYLYGFIERYPKDKTYLTGYSAESWHWRYVGIDIAKIIQDDTITFDEYYAYYIEK